MCDDGQEMEVKTCREEACLKSIPTFYQVAYIYSILLRAERNS